VTTETPAAFRNSAFQRYLKARREAVLPRYVAPPTFAVAWALAAIALAALVAAFRAEVPRYASGPAVAVEWDGSSPLGGATHALLCLLPAAELERLEPGQDVFLSFEPTGERVARRVVEVLPGALSPNAVAERFGLRGAAAALVGAPTAVALARLDPPDGGVDADALPGSVYRVDVEVGHHRLLSLVPGIGRLF